MLARLIRKAEEREQDECGPDHKPARELEAEQDIGKMPPNGGWNLKDTRVVLAIMCFRPGFPRFRMQLRKAVEYIRCHRQGDEHLGGGKSH